MHMASQIVKVARDGLLEWTDVRTMLASAADDQATHNNPEGVNEDREQTYKKKNEKEAKDILLVGDTWGL